MRPTARWRRLITPILGRIARRVALWFGRAVPPAANDPGRGARGPNRPLRAGRHAAGAIGTGRDESLDPGIPVASDDRGLGEAPPFGDFTDQDEVQRFAGLPPIGAEALEGVDWDELARELTGPR